MVDSTRRAIVKAIGGTVGGLGALTASSGAGAAADLEWLDAYVEDATSAESTPERVGDDANPLGDGWNPLEGYDLDDEAVDGQSQTATSVETADESAVGEDGEDVEINVSV